ncbi:MAG: LysM peptidoglycan-binding domain-containing protein [Caldilineaceae bacterium]
MVVSPYITYQVQRGDTLSALAQRYQVSVESIMASNGLVSSLIYVGQTLQIPQSLGYPHS